MSAICNTSKPNTHVPFTPKKNKKVKTSGNKDALISTFLRIKNNKMNVESIDGTIIRIKL